jgi:hypothetical protein
LPRRGVISPRAASTAAWTGITRSSSLLRAHAPDPFPPLDLRLSLLPRVFAGCCKPLLGTGPSRHYLCNPCVGAWTPTPRCPSGAQSRFFPENIGLTLGVTGSAHQFAPAMQLPQGKHFGAAVISLCSGSHACWTPRLHPPQPFSWAAGPFTPRTTRLVACPELWYRYVSESGN